jgi:endonuclease/exonuclease/phosphatase family metal-dependent hydrolase
MTRIVSYNILAGGYSLRENGARRTKQLTQMIRSVQPDVVGLVEATHPFLTQKPLVVEELAEALGMQLIPGGDAAHNRDYQLALLTRLPVVYTKIHPRSGILNKPLLEVCLEESNGQHLTVFLTHFHADFHRGWAGNQLREPEAREILRIMAPLREQGKPHLLMGDFNSLAPGDPFKASFLLRYVVDLDEARKTSHVGDGHPQLELVVPPKLRFLMPLLRIIPDNQWLCSLFDAAAAFYAPRGSIRILQEGGYIDSYRKVHPHEWGFTCPAALPAGRIDYIFASPDLAERLEECDTMVEGEGIPGSLASDHLPVTAAFGLGVQESSVQAELDSAISH